MVRLWGSLASDLDPRQRRTCTFAVPAGGAYFQGLHMHLLVSLDETTTIDSYAQDTSWECLYVPLLASPLWLPGGTTLEFRCSVDASTDSPTYHVDVHARFGAQTGPHSITGSSCTNVHVVGFSWSGDG